MLVSLVVSGFQHDSSIPHEIRPVGRSARSARLLCVRAFGMSVKCRFIPNMYTMRSRRLGVSGVDVPGIGVILPVLSAGRGG